MYKNRGMLLENILNKTIKYYWTNNIAFIEKKSLPIVFKNILSENNSFSIQRGYVKSKSTVDYIGCYKGIFVCFEAKSTNEMKLDLTNIKEHQVSYLNSISKNGGVAFFIFFFSKVNEFYLTSVQEFNKLLEKKHNLKSLKYEEIKKYSFKITLTFPGILEFLIFIDYII